MEHLVLLFHTLVIPVIAVALVVICLYKKDSFKGPFRKDLIWFFVSLIVAALSYMILFYDYCIANISLPEILYAIGWDLVFCIYVFFWVRMSAETIGGEAGSIIKKINFAILISYCTQWVLSLIYLYGIFDRVYEMFNSIIHYELLICSFILVIFSAKNKYLRPEIWYLSLGSFLLFVSVTLEYIYQYDVLLIDITEPIAWIIIAVFVTVYCIRKKSTNESGNSEKSTTLKDEGTVLNEIRTEFGLTERELDVLKMIFEGKNNETIGEELYISGATVKTHIHNLLKKLNVSRRIDAVIMINQKMKENSEEDTRNN